jgi:predicted Fe-Mo cluster-binding NifX family protein
MKIVITAKGNTLDAAVDPRFGRAAYFIVFDTENETFEVIDNSAAAGLGGGAGVQAGAAVTRHNPQAVITGHCGPKAFRTLQAASIEVFTGAKGTVAEAIADHKNGKLSAVNGPDVAGHW